MNDETDSRSLVLHLFCAIPNTHTQPETPGQTRRVVPFFTRFPSFLSFSSPLFYVLYLCVCELVCISFCFLFFLFPCLYFV